MAKKKILIVDDEADELLVMSTSLEDVGYEVVTAQDAPEARKLLAAEMPDLIITDLMMPGESGFSLLTSVKQDSAFSEIPVIVTSVMDAESDVLRQGADAYLPKPFEPKELVEMANQLTSRADIPGLMKKATSLLNDKKFKEAEAVLHTILENCEEGSYPAYAAFYLGEITRSEGHLDDAALFYKKALEYESNFWRAYTQLGTVFHAKKETEQALKYWEQSLRLNSDQKQVAAFVARLRKEMG